MSTLPAASTVTLNGCIKAWFNSKGWGLLIDTLGREYFAHPKEFAPDSIRGDKVNGQQVEFETIPGPHSGKWPKALNIRVIRNG